MVDPLILNFQTFRDRFFGTASREFGDLVSHGQKPKTMVIGCADSRTDPAILFDTRPGDLFMVRNVANLVPPYAPDDGQHGVSAALEYGVRDLKVENIIVLGHGLCGGVQALCNHHRKLAENGGKADAPSREFIGRWIEIATPAMAEIDFAHWQDSFQHDAERASIKNSIANLRGFPWIAEAVDAGKLHLHGWWFDMENGALWGLDEASGDFIKLAPNPSASKPS
ncbi:MAG: Carbonic anhydrase 1 [Rhodospirillaceae bacterium]|jgi:carbonic anhydrase|nr:MAG: Carbonic anhydrase 1 [Rhodospirillaceae bacterium]